MGKPVPNTAMRKEASRLAKAAAKIELAKEAEALQIAKDAKKAAEEAELRVKEAALKEAEALKAAQIAKAQAKAAQIAMAQAEGKARAEAQAVHQIGKEKDAKIAQILEALELIHNNPANLHAMHYNASLEANATIRLSNVFYLFMVILVLIFSTFAAKQVLRLPELDFFYGFDFASYYLYAILLCYLLSRVTKGSLKFFVHVICLFTVLNLVITAVPKNSNCEKDENCIWNTKKNIPPISEDWWLFVDPFKGKHATFIGPNAEENFARVLWFHAIKKVSSIETKSGVDVIDQIKEGGWGTILSLGIFGSLESVFKFVFEFLFSSDSTKTFVQVTVLVSAFVTCSTLIDLIPFIDGQFREFLVLIALFACIYFLAAPNVLYALVNIAYLFFGLIPDQIYQQAVKRVVSLEQKQRLSLSQEVLDSLTLDNTSEENKLVSLSGPKENLKRFAASLIHPGLPDVADEIIATLIQNGRVRIVVPPRPKSATEFFANSSLFLDKNEFCAFIERMDGNKEPFDEIIQKRVSQNFYKQVAKEGPEKAIEFIDGNYTSLFPDTSSTTYFLFKYYLSPIAACVENKNIPLFYDYSILQQLRMLIGCKSNPVAFVNNRVREIFEMDNMKQFIPEEIAQNVLSEVEEQERKLFSYTNIGLYRKQLEEFGFLVPPFPEGITNLNSIASAQYLKLMVVGRKEKLASNAQRIKFKNK